MAAMFIGIFIGLTGAAIMANAAFSERSQMGFYICLVGAIITIGGIIELIV